MNRTETLITLLKDLQATGHECEWIEFKVNNSDPQEIGKNISALSNSACYHEVEYGYLVFGIEDITKHFVGTSFVARTTMIGNQELENWLATQLSPRIDFNIFEFNYEDRDFVIFKIAATRNTPVKFRNEDFIRIGSYTKSLKDHPEKERKIWNNSNLSFEKNAALLQVSNDDILRLIDYPGYFDMMELPLPDNRDGILKKLIEEKIVDKFEGSLFITNLGAILFAKNINEFESLSRKAIRVVVYNGENRVKTTKEQVGTYGYAIGFQGLIKYLNDQLPTREIIDGARRKQLPLYPPLAVREIVANAIIHQDFNIEGTSPMIEIFDNRIEITNPGKALIDPLRFVDHSPQSRNETLARFMRRLSICEERGSGIDKVVFECELHQLPAPDFIVAENYTRVILYAQKSLRQMDKQDKVRACYQHACLKYVTGRMMTNQSLRERLGVEDHNYSLVSRIISDTKDAGLVKDYDPTNRSRTYAKYLPFWG